MEILDESSDLTLSFTDRIGGGYIDRERGGAIGPIKIRRVCNKEI